MPLCNALSSSFAGVLEMNGFKVHFSYLFNNTMIDGDLAGNSDALASNDTSPDFCGSPTASNDNSKTCGSGNGASSASVIVSSAFCHQNWLCGKHIVEAFVHPFIAHCFDCLQGLIVAMAGLGSIFGSNMGGCK